MLFLFFDARVWRNGRKINYFIEHSFSVQQNAIKSVVKHQLMKFMMQANDSIAFKDVSIFF